jgi:hypothetical protein
MSRFAALEMGVVHLERRQQLNSVRQCVEEAWRFHPCCQDVASAADAGLPDCLTRSATERKVTFVSHHCRHHIQIPSWRCSKCMMEFEPQAQHAACWPTLVNVSATWVHMSMLRLYRELSRAGLTCTGAATFRGLAVRSVTACCCFAYPCHHSPMKQTSTSFCY